ncbi:dihydroxyacetone kinase subunit DhaL [Scrofimicrobium sp. R131]|uniref:Dihydroxyacetone kinase subunit DhaL n=1 Tax=Scrofimicrobium appendicitidis TaxID=3079930 RepID=A0AAU7V562_9ACTO
MTKSVDWAREWIRRSAKAVSENREYLIELDRQIGDGDHGENLDRGFSAVLRGGGLEEAETGADVLKYVAKTLMSTVGGAAGPLYGTAFLRAAQKFPAEELTSADVAELLAAALGGVQARGKAVAGEKTMVDVLIPASEVAAAAAEAGATVPETWQQVAERAAVAAEETIPLKATKGRASYLGERSIGHQDPGATSTSLVLQAGADAAAEVFGGSGGE